MAKFSAAIVGAGFCGTMAAVQFSRLAPGSRIALIEGNDRHGPGLAYGTGDPDHLLNVRAGQMGAFPDDADGFRNWLEKNGKRYAADDFVPRKFYGDYLQQTLRDACAANPDLCLLRQRIVAMRRTSSGFELVGENGELIAADKVVLALGNFAPGQNENGSAQNPYSPETWRALGEDGDVLLIGTGLTSLDLIVTLAKTKKAGTIHLLSRHGLLPREHAEPKIHNLSLDETKLPETALALCRVVRGEVAAAVAKGLPWQSVIDALRPLHQKLWQSLNTDEQRRFLRHLRACWDVCRHRCPPKVMDAYRQLEREHRIQLHRGSIISQTPIADGWRVEWRRRGAAKSEHFDVRHVVRCTGPQSDFRKLADPLVRNLLEQGIIMPDALQLGIATAGDYTVLGKDGRVDGLYALGSLLKGRLYESVAVPELRAQAFEVARMLSGGF